MAERIQIKSAARPVELEYEWIAPERAQAPLIVFLHEGLGSMATWKDFPRRLCDAAQCRGFNYSRYGYGSSTPAASGKWPRDYMHREGRELLPALLAELGLEGERPWIFGHSDGATIALLFAAAHADVPVGVIAVAPHTFVEEVTVAGVLRAGAAYPTGRLRARLAQFHPDAEAVFWRWHDTWADPAFRSWNIEALIGSIRCPVLAIQGDADEFATLAQLESIKRHVPHAEIGEIADCGHIPHREQADNLLATTVRFMFNGKR